VVLTRRDDLSLRVARVAETRKLTGAETSVLAHVAQGEANKDIANAPRLRSADHRGAHGVDHEELRL